MFYHTANGPKFEFDVPCRPNYLVLVCQVHVCSERL